MNWLPCEVEALGIAAAVKHFSPFIIQSEHHACILTDSKPCVQVIDKLRRGEFSASPRVTSFLSVVSRYQIDILHLAGSANIPSDFSSRNAPECDNPQSQVCSFISMTLLYDQRPPTTSTACHVYPLPPVFPGSRSSLSAPIYAGHTPISNQEHVPQRN